MKFTVKAQAVDPAKVLNVSPEVIANQRVGSRLAFAAPHDLTVEFANGSIMVDGIDLIIYIIPQEFFCYRGEEMVVKFNLETRGVEIALEPSVRNIPPRAIIRPACGE